MRIVAILAVVTAVMLGCGAPQPVKKTTEKTTVKAAAPAPLPVAPMPREVKPTCNCIYCSCCSEPFEGQKPHECRCGEKRCKDNGCKCEKWKK